MGWFCSLDRISWSANRVGTARVAPAARSNPLTKLTWREVKIQQQSKPLPRIKRWNHMALQREKQSRRPVVVGLFPVYTEVLIQSTLQSGLESPGASPLFPPHPAATSLPKIVCWQEESHAVITKDRSDVSSNSNLETMSSRAAHGDIVLYVNHHQ